MLRAISSDNEICFLLKKSFCQVTLFTAASNDSAAEGDLLLEHRQALGNIFHESPALIVIDCESAPVIESKLELARSQGRTTTILTTQSFR